MDRRLFNAAYSGDVNMLQHLLRENPFILSDYHLTTNSHRETPLTVAVKANQLHFAREILRLKPELSLELNQDGLGPLDVASAYGNLEIVREILAAGGPEVCRCPGRDGRTAIHYAAMHGRVEIIDKLVSACPASAKDVTAFGETVLHLAVKCFKVEALRSLLQWLEKHDMVEVVRWADMEGNTVLHYAASKKHIQSIELLVGWNNTTGNMLELNAVNKKGLTAMDIVDIFIESSTDIQLREILRRAGASSASEVHILTESTKPDPGLATSNRPSGEKPKNWVDVIEHFEFKWGRDSVGEARQSLLVIAALIATVTFEAGINPPSYLFEASDRTNFNITAQYPNGTTVTNPSTSSNLTRSLDEMQRITAEGVSLTSITIFLVANSVALSTAWSIIDYMTVGFPFQRELRVSMLTMIFAYAWSSSRTRPTGTVKDVMLAVALSTPLFLRLLPFMISKFRKRNK